jgi:hypothetical protein
MSHRKLVVVAILTCALTTVALADPPTLTIHERAVLVAVADPVEAGILVTVSVNCGDGRSFGNFVVVGVRQNEFAFQGEEAFDSDGTRKEVEVRVLGTFDPGEAVASALLECGALFEGQVLGQTIKIVE